MRLALYQPDIPQNTGTILRLAACFGVGVDIIEPCGFPFSQKALRRAGMDYLPQAVIARHSGWDSFQAAHRMAGGRLVALTTQAETSLYRFSFSAADTLMLGRESAGLPPEIHDAADARIRIPMRAGLRSLNVAVAGAIALSEALRQTGIIDTLETIPEDTAPQT